MLVNSSIDKFNVSFKKNDVVPGIPQDYWGETGDLSFYSNFWERKTDFYLTYEKANWMETELTFSCIFRYVT